MQLIVFFAVAAADTVEFITSKQGDVHCGCTVGGGETAFQDFVACAKQAPNCTELYFVTQSIIHRLDKSDGDNAEVRLLQDYVEGSYLSAVHVPTIAEAVPGNVTITVGQKSIVIADCTEHNHVFACSIPPGKYSDEQTDVIRVRAEHNNLDVNQPFRFTKSYGRWPESCRASSMVQKIYFTSNSGQWFCDCQVGDALAEDTFAKFAECIAAKPDCRDNFSIMHMMNFAPDPADVIDWRKVRIPRKYAKGAHLVHVDIPAIGDVREASASSAGKVLCMDEFNYSKGDNPRATLKSGPCSNTDIESDYVEIAVDGGRVNPGYGYFTLNYLLGKYDLNCPAH